MHESHVCARGATGFNERVVNPGMKPFKGYWIVINDSGMINEFWQRVSWNEFTPDGCAVEVYVRAADDRADLARGTFLAVSNNAPFTGVNGRYIEVRLAMTRDDPSKQPVVYDLTLHGVTSSFTPGAFLDDASAYETEDARFTPYISGAEPLTYQWFVQYPWMTNNQWTMLPGETNSEFVMSNVDLWVGGYLDDYNVFHWTQTRLCVTDATGESLWLEPAYLDLRPLEIDIPPFDSTGPASRYPAIINIFGLTTNLARVKVALWGLAHQRSADLDILLVTPCGTNVMLMSHVGGTNAVIDADLIFQEYYSAPAETGQLQSGTYGPSNYGQLTQLPSIGLDPPPSGPYSTNLADLAGGNPNGLWKLYIYDDRQGGYGQISGSVQGTWQLRLDFQ
jgi:hypothetical protein